MRTRPLALLLATLLLLGLAAMAGPAQAAPATCENGIVVADPDAHRGLVIDCANLLGAKTQLTAATPLNWGGDTPIAEWDGVSLGGDPPRVVEVDLRSSFLSGRIAAQFGRLTALRGLYLQNNKLTGPIPPELGSLRDLERLSLHENRLRGPIPDTLGSLDQLEVLWLRGNDLAGCIPPLRDVRFNDLHALGLTDCGAPPSPPPPCENGTAVTRPADNPGLVTDCVILLAVKDPLRGDAPLNWDPAIPIAEWDGVTVYGTPPRVQTLSLIRKQLTGRIPAELGSLRGLESLHLHQNNLTGTIPPELGALSNLRVLWLSGNQFTGPIPAELGSLAGLRQLDLHDNRLSGTIPVELALLRRLEYLYLGGNQLTGAIPVQLASLRRLYRLDLPDNQFSGPIPMTLGSMPELAIVILNDNQLTGPIPAELGSLRHLESLRLHNNQLSGPVPPALAELKDLVRLSLSGNLDLTGCIPPTLRDIPHNDLADIALPDCPP